MSIQEIIFVLGSIVFIWALIPSVLKNQTPNQLTSFLTGMTLGIFGLTYITMNFEFAAITSFITSFLWFVMFFQSRYLPNNTRNKDDITS